MGGGSPVVGGGSPGSLPAFNPRDYTPEQLAVIEAALRLMKAGGSAPAEPEATAMSGDTIGMRTQFHRNESEDRGLGIR